MTRGAIPTKSTVRDVAELAGVSVGTVSRALNELSGVSEEIRAKVLQAAAELAYNTEKLRQDDTRVGLTDIAKSAGVSIGSVSRALNNHRGVSIQTRQRVLEAAEQLGYDTDNLRLSSIERVGVLIHRGANALATNLFYAPVLHGVEVACRKRKLVMSFASVGPEDDILELIEYHHVDALISIGFFEPEILEQIRSSGKTLVLVDYAAKGFDSVNSDNFGGAHRIVTHLIKNGRKRIAFISGPLEHYSINERLRGYRQALEDAGIKIDPKLIVKRDPLDEEEGARAAMQKLLKLSKRPDAVFAFNDASAVSAMQICLEVGLKIPEDIAFVGFDDIATAAYLRPSLTTVRVPKEELGTKGVELLLDLHDGHVKRSSIIAIEVVFRESSGD